MSQSIIALIDQLFGSWDNILMALKRGLISLAGGYATLYLILLIFRIISETRKGHPDAWKDETTKVVVVLLAIAGIGIVGYWVW